MTLLLLMTTISIPAEKFINHAFAFAFVEPCRSVPTQIFYGGASSGKSVFIAQRDILDMVNEERNFLVVRNTAATLRSSVFEERRKAIRQFFLSPLFEVRESDLMIKYLPRGTQMIFRGLDDPEKLKSITVPVGTLTDVRYEEATEMSEGAIEEVGRRMRGLSAVSKREVFSFNPIFRNHWICKKYFGGQAIKYRRTEDLLLFHTTYRDNRFLSPQDVRRLDAYVGYQRDVYRDGKWGVLGDLIFTDWEVADLEGTTFDSYRYGCDFGFSVDPSAVLEVAFAPAKRTIYVTKELYQRGMTNDVLAEKARPIVGENIVWCDSAEPKSIMELKTCGIVAHAVAKGRDSVWHALQWLQQWHIVIDKRCVNTISEISQYQWQKNKNGETLTVPVEKDDHSIAALRYATERDRIGAVAAVV